MDVVLIDEDAVGEAARRVAGILPPDERIAARVDNAVESVIMRDAVTIAGRSFVPVNPRLTEPEVAHVLGEARAALIDVRAICEAGRDAGPGRPRRRDEIGATILFTSGTTGLPRGCVRTAEQEAARARELIATYALAASDVHLIVCPLAHSAPGIFLRACRAAGARTLLASRFDPPGTWEAIARHRVTLIFLVPTQVERLLLAPAGDVSSLRAVIVAGAPFPRATRARFEAVLGPGKLWEFYGSSETGTITVLPPGDDPGEDGCVGRPPPGVEVELRAGEVFVRSPAVMSGYLGEPPRPPDAFVSVGDLARHDDRGRLILVDRKHDLVITGGVNVAPAEVERALAAHPAVAGAVVAGLPDPDWGQRLVALVATRAPLDESTLRAFLRERLASFKIPKEIVFVSPDRLPIGSSGKPLRRRVAEIVTSVRPI